MKLGVANRITVTDADLDETAEFHFGYHTVVELFQTERPDYHHLGQAFLNNLEEGIR